MMAYLRAEPLAVDVAAGEGALAAGAGAELGLCAPGVFAAAAGGA